MAGAGYKLFNTGDVLTAQQVNEYLMQQTTMVFADAAARTSALSGVLAEGMVSYLQDTNTLEVYDGSAWVGATGDITGLTAGTGISISSATGPVPTITNDVATEFDAKGDLVVGTGDNAFDRLPVGNSGETIVADSSQTTGLRYNPPVGSLGNPVVNGGMDVWQRGTSFAGANSVTNYTADRWIGYRTGFTFSRQTTSDTTNLPNIQYAMRCQRDSGGTTTSIPYLTYNHETVNSIPYAGKTVTLSFYARRGANFSGVSNQINVDLTTGTGTDQNALIGLTGPVINANLVTLTTSWQRFVVTANIGTTATQITHSFYYSPSGTAGANDWFEITGVQIDVGTYTASTAPTFRRSGNTLAGELSAAQRYYWRSSSTGFYSTHGWLNAYSTTATRGLVNLPVTMRVAPTSVDFGNLAINLWASGLTTFTNLTLVADESSRNTASVETTGSTGLTANRSYTLANNNNSAGYIGFSAEL